MKRLIALGLAIGVVVAGCGGGGLLGGGLKIGMVTDIGQLEDKSFNEFSWKGVQDGASAVGGTAPRTPPRWPIRLPNHRHPVPADRSGGGDRRDNA